MQLLVTLLLLSYQPSGSPASGTRVENLPTQVVVCSAQVSRSEAFACTTSVPRAEGTFVRGVETAQIAFIDPETGALVQPTRAQLEEFAAIVEDARRFEEVPSPTFETLPDGTLKASGLPLQSRVINLVPLATDHVRPSVSGTAHD